LEDPLFVFGLVRLSFCSVLLWNIRKWGKDKLEIENRRFFIFLFPLLLSDFITFALTFHINGVGIKVVMDFFLFFFCSKRKICPYISLFGVSFFFSLSP